jgi:hypothetical protein
VYEGSKEGEEELFVLSVGFYPFPENRGKIILEIR